MISITGHTRGIGKYFFDILDDTVGFTKSTGYDISVLEDRQRIFDESSDADIFINNAWDPVGQLELLKLFYSNWLHKDKIIINIGSATIYAQPQFIQNKEYNRSKIELHQYINTLILGPDKPLVKELILGPVNTDMLTMDVPSSMELNELHDSIHMMISNNSIRQLALIKEWTPREN